ncbi:MAG: imidazolonepropionase [Bdellovibrionaceae bacterium]|nr:imidazolonepropionase [Bdellovibrio sp.]
MSQKLFRNLRLVNSEFTGSEAKRAFIVEAGLITWMGSQNQIPKKLKPKKEFDLKNNLVFPSFIECHTHTVFAGSRAQEFEMRNQGVSYLEIAERGGGILSTVQATRATSAKSLTALTQKRVNNFLAQGVSTLEIKSGYGLDLKNEIKVLQVIKNLKGPRIISTFLGAHAKPAEFKTHEDYLQYLVTTVLPVVKKKKLSDRVDIFIENKFFEKSASQKYLEAAKKLGFAVTIHANQLSFSEGADLALELSAHSADHVIHLNENHIKAFAKSKTVAVLLPAADLYMRCAYPSARKLIDAGATVALATDFNPGSCPTQDLALVGLLARLEMKMSLPEVFKAYTSGAAQALGVSDAEGQLLVGKSANFISTAAELNDFFYSAGSTPKHQLFIRGNEIKSTIIARD